MTEKEKILKQGELEALLFLMGEPLSLKRIASFLEVSFNEVKDLLKDFSEALKSESRGLNLLVANDKVQLVTKPIFSSLIKKIIQEDFRQNLTPAALETLTIIAYLGPLPRSLIDYLRGVNSSYILRNLLIRGLIEKTASAKRSNIYYYQITLEFLKHLGLTQIKDLPAYEKYRELFQKFEIENSEIKN